MVIVGIHVLRSFINSIPKNQRKSKTKSIIKIKKNSNENSSKKLHKETEWKPDVRESFTCLERICG